MTEPLTNNSNGTESLTQGDHPFGVVIKSTGAVVRVGATQTVVEALQASGVLVPTSCQEGWCGTCLTAVLEGEIEHRDVYLSPSEQTANDQFLPCCSRAKSDRLVIDL
jgi:vanillate O-demethylase ferredoxin subunit